jgi:hypothetical protein
MLSRTVLSDTGMRLDCCVLHSDCVLASGISAHETQIKSADVFALNCQRMSTRHHRLASHVEGAHPKSPTTWRVPFAGAMLVEAAVVEALGGHTSLLDRQ